MARPRRICGQGTGLWMDEGPRASGALACCRPGIARSGGGTVKVDIATLQSMAGQCRNEAADATARQATLSSGINTSVLDGWTDSQAAARFTELYEEWRRSAQGVS